MKNNQPVTNNEKMMLDGEILVTKTNLKGITEFQHPLKEWGV
jgi:hypothetical protein